jgi:hypothetical protein
MVITGLSVLSTFGSTLYGILPPLMATVKAAVPLTVAPSAGLV